MFMHYIIYVYTGPGARLHARARPGALPAPREALGLRAAQVSIMHMYVCMYVCMYVYM